MKNSKPLNLADIMSAGFLALITLVLFLSFFLNIEGNKTVTIILLSLMGLLFFLPLIVKAISHRKLSNWQNFSIAVALILLILSTAGKI
jgi:hypothetical protein